MVLNPRLRLCTSQQPGLRYEDADTSPLIVDGGEVPFTLKFKFLGSLLTYNLKDDCEIDARIRSAQGAFREQRMSENTESLR